MNSLNVFELRQYTVHPGQRDVLIDLFDREFVETQEEAGIRVIGQFRDEDDPDRFVWIRGFPDMNARREALTAFYIHGAAWRTHRSAAGATMLDTDNVLLLRPARSESGFTLSSARPALDADTLPNSRVTLTIYHPAISGEDFAAFFEQHVKPMMAETAAPPVAYLSTEPAPNTYPALPVRTDENVFVWLAVFADSDHRRDHERQLSQPNGSQRQVLSDLTHRLNAPPQHLRLAPTARSQLR
ncbi:quinol monooxygenase YgiN [Nocardia sp. GAS34]|uniref:NIPSNAP family protein n=1 Tax=unclassified Nocardia TaxID=2637762 RepID=UPI003D22F965